MLDLIQFLSGNISVVLTVSGIFIFGWSSFEVLDFYNGVVQPRLSPNKHVQLFGTFLAVAGVVVSILADVVGNHVPPAKKSIVEGRFMYVVHHSDGVFSHSGECNFILEGNLLRITGTRLFQCREVDGRIICCQAKAPWRTEWAEICSDGRLRFTYQMVTADHQTIYGFTDLEVLENGTIISGSYALLAPVPVTSPPVVDRGLIRFTRLKKGEEVVPPAYDTRLPEGMPTKMERPPTKARSHENI